VDTDDEVSEYYARGGERDRLASGAGLLEWLRTQELLLRHLPPPPAVVADIGGGPGRYARWLASLGHHVHHRDLMSLHVQQLAQDAQDDGLEIESAVGDARMVDLPDASVDAVLLLGPLYHLSRRADRVQVLREAGRIVRPGGVVFAAAISRWAARLDGLLTKRMYDELPQMITAVDEVERTGRLPLLHPGAFRAFCHRPDQLRREVRSSGLELVGLVVVEGSAALLVDLDERLADPFHRDVVLASSRATEAVPELMGVGPHLLATARRPI
jgi:SAM-dependent methyltransferase